MKQEQTLLDFQQDWSNLVDKAFADYNSLTKEERVWFNVQSIISDVDNGGLISHYYNSGADRNKETIDDLTDLGFGNLAELLIKMNKLFPGGQPSTDIEERNDVIANWPDGHYDTLLEDLDNKFYEGEQNLKKKLIEYITNNGLSK